MTLRKYQTFLFRIEKVQLDCMAHTTWPVYGCKIRHCGVRPLNCLGAVGGEVEWPRELAGGQALNLGAPLLMTAAIAYRKRRI
jgi:hypothetical protein